MSSGTGTAERKYEEPRAHALRERYLAAFGGDEIPVPVEAIAEDLLGLRIEQEWGLEYSGMLLPAERKIVLNAAEAPHDAAPLRRFRFTIAHEVGHWVCHVVGAGARGAGVLPREGHLGGRRPRPRARGERLRRRAPDAGASGAGGVGGARRRRRPAPPASTSRRPRCSGGSTASARWMIRPKARSPA